MKTDTLQAIVRMKYLFREFVVKVWRDTDFSSSIYRKLNKIVAKHCMLHYESCWDHRNESYHNETIQRERIIKWHEKVKTRVERDKLMQVKLFVIRNRIRVEQSKTKKVLQ